MEGKLQTSFIPKKPLIEGKKGSSANIFSILAWLIFILILAAAGCVFAYNRYLTKSIDTMTATLNEKFAHFDNKAVDQISALDIRLETAKKILNSHLIISKLLELIGQNTLKSIQFRSFNYAATDGSNPVLTLLGRAPDFSSVALQSDTFSDQKYLKNQIFSNLALDSVSGGVTFKFTGTVDPSNFKYMNYIKDQNQPVTVSSSSTTPF